MNPLNNSNTSQTNSSKPPEKVEGSDTANLEKNVEKKKNITLQILTVVGVFLALGIIALIIISANNSSNLFGNIRKLFAGKNSTSSNTTTFSNTTTVAPLASLSMTCGSAGQINIVWKAPPNVSSLDSVNGYITDTVSKNKVYTFSPEYVNSAGGTFVWTGANYNDNYSTTAWIQSSTGVESFPITSAILNSSTCSAKTVAVAKGSLSCNNFIVTQNGVSGTTFTAGSSSPVEITSGIKDTLATANIDYSKALWSVSPLSGTLTPSSSGNSVSWQLPSTVSGSSENFTISLSGVTDNTGAQLSAPCTVVLTVDAQSTAVLPNTGFDVPTYMLIAIGFILMVVGLIYSYFTDIISLNIHKKKIIKRFK